MRVGILAAIALAGGCSVPAPVKPVASEIGLALPCDFKCDDTGACEMSSSLRDVSNLKCTATGDPLHPTARCSFTATIEDLNKRTNETRNVTATYARKSGQLCSLSAWEVKALPKTRSN